MVSTHRDALELAIKWMGGAFSAVFAVFAVYKSYYYAEINLPDRIVEFVKRAIKRVVRVRRPLISALFGASIFDLLEPVSSNAPAKKGVRAWMQVRQSRRAAKALLDTQRSLDDEIRMLSIRKSFCESQRITAHLVQGLQLSAEAVLGQRNSETLIAKRERALGEFEKALKLKEDDLDALQFAAREAKAMNDEAGALRFLGHMAEAAQAANEPVRHARALRFQAEIIDGRGNRRNWDEARDHLADARDLLGVAQARDHLLDAPPNWLAERSLELARVRELLGAVQIKREKFRAARQELEKARSAYNQLTEPERTDGIARADALLAQLTQAEDEPDEPTVVATPPAPLFELHTNPEELEVMMEDGAAVRLAAFTAVTVIEIEDGRVIIAKDGKKLGRVEERGLRKLN